jgi:hypothetical protein
MATITAPETPETQTTPKPDLFTYIQSLVDQLHPDERLQLVSYIVSTVQPFIVDPVDDDDDDEELLRDAMEALEYARAHPETVMTLQEFEAELDRAEAAGELPD